MEFEQRSLGTPGGDFGWSRGKRGSAWGGGDGLDGGRSRAWGQEGVGHQRGGAQKDWGPEGWGAQNFAFFSPSSASISFFFSLSLASKPPAFHTAAEEPKRAHFRVAALQTPPKFNVKTPKRGRKNEKCGG